MSEGVQLINRGPYEQKANRQICSDSGTRIYSVADFRSSHNKYGARNRDFCFSLQLDWAFHNNVWRDDNYILIHIFNMLTKIGLEPLGARYSDILQFSLRAS
jgi:hypothetical protein